MNKIPVKYAIELNSWFKCSFRLWGETTFNIRVVNLHKVPLTNLNKYDINTQEFDFSNGKLLIMNIDFVNTSKTAYCENVFTKFNLIDQDDFCFPCINDYNIKQYAIETQNDDKFYKIFNSITFRPKIICKGSILFFVPNDDNAEYFIGCDDGCGLITEL